MTTAKWLDLIGVCLFSLGFTAALVGAVIHSWAILLPATVAVIVGAGCMAVSIVAIGRHQHTGLMHKEK